MNNDVSGNAHKATNSDMPACVECRRRKLRCSRELPTCKECRRLSVACQYEARENKPGMKTGAVENLNRRVDHLEALILHIQQQIEPITHDFQGTRVTNPCRVPRPSPRSALDLLESFERELTQFKNSSHHDRGQPGHVAASSKTSASPHEYPGDDTSFNRAENSRKRRRLNSDDTPSLAERVLEIDTLPFDVAPEELLASIMAAYFSQVHPWIPMIHQGRFSDRLRSQTDDSTIEVILHAMVVAAIRFVRFDNLDNAEHILQITKKSRDFVILNAFDTLNVENLQALIMIAFDDIGKGETEKAWSIVGSLTRTVEYLQLSIEAEDLGEQPLLRPCSSLQPPQSWIEVEERRRVFWNIFNLDRFCSVVTGWNTSLTSDDVHRCLPADGFLWRKGKSVLTPYFGIWDKSAGRIGNSIAFLPAQYSSPGQATDGSYQSPIAASPLHNNNVLAGISSIGAFAYCIEATESMSQVTTYFLQQKINLKDQKQIESWLTRFKELDLRLVHWKMFLPQKWKDTKLRSQKSAEIIMDPNLTVAHITHNSSMILLHQLIAYPSKEWTWATRLPSRNSADTCQSAAVEIATITQNYLASSTSTNIFNSQFVFCIFIAARLLLIHWRYYSFSTPSPELAILVHSLEIISTRWQGRLDQHVSKQTNLAGKYASQIRQLHEKCKMDTTFRLDVLGYASTSSIKSPQTIITQSSSGPPPQTNHQDKDRRHSYHHPSQHDHLNTVPSQRPINGTQQSHQAVIAPPPPPAPSQHPQSHQPPPPPVQSPIKKRTPTFQYGLAPILNSTEPPHATNNPNNTTTSTSPYSIPQSILDPHNSHNHQNPQDNSNHNSGNNNNNNMTNMSDYDLNSISQMFFDQQYIEMDRVINFDDGMFSAMGYGDMMGGEPM